jgi:alanine or glycine:cation symporter, AGCS family
VPAGWTGADDHFLFALLFGLLLAAVVLAVVAGKLPRIGRVTGILVPAMVAGYLLLTAVVLALHADQVWPALTLIVRDAFTGEAAAGGVLGAVIITGIRRAAFSNEAGIGTEAMAHGAARTREPVREGMVAMLGPIIDTLIVCTCTALVILISGVWSSGDDNGVSLTVNAFNTLFLDYSAVILAVLVGVLSLSTVFTFWYYGSKCLGFLIGARHQHHYVWVYLILVVLGAVASLSTVIKVVDSMYALMALPTMIASLRLAPRVNRAARAYFARSRDDD